MKDVLKQIDFGQLTDPIETPKQREAFCSRASSAKPIIEEIITRMLCVIGQDYFGGIWNDEQKAYVNGMIKFAQDMRAKIVEFESEHLGYRENARTKDKDQTIISGSNLEL